MGQSVIPKYKALQYLDFWKKPKISKEKVAFPQKSCYSTALYFGITYILKCVGKFGFFDSIQAVLKLYKIVLGIFEIMVK